MSPKSKKLDRKPMVFFTQELKEKWLLLYRQNGKKYLSAEMVGISTRALDDHLQNDEEFRHRANDAKQCWVDEHVLSTAIDLATKGVDRPLLGGKFKDEIITTQKEYSIPTLHMLLRKDRPEYRDNAGGGAGGGGGGVLLIPIGPGDLSKEDWEAKYSAMARGEIGKDIPEVKH